MCSNSILLQVWRIFSQTFRNIPMENILTMDWSFHQRRIFSQWERGFTNGEYSRNGIVVRAKENILAMAATALKNKRERIFSSRIASVMKRRIFSQWTRRRNVKGEYSRSEPPLFFSKKLKK